jgi:hypothetical protein
MKQGGIVKNPFQTEPFERFSELSRPNGNFPDGLARKNRKSNPGKGLFRTRSAILRASRRLARQ